MKMNQTKTLLAALSATAMMTGSASAATLINTYGPSNITVTASDFINGNTAPSKTIDASGLNTGTGEHNSGTQTSWMNSANNNDVSDEWIQWDLGASYILDSIQVWNYNDSSRFDSGVKNLDIYVSNTLTPGDPEGAGVGNWTKIGDNVTLSKAPGAAGYTGVDLETDTGISIPLTDVRYVRFEINSTHWDGTNPGAGLGEHQAGIGEIQFFEGVPEPGSLALLGLGGLLVASRRRRG